MTETANKKEAIKKLWTWWNDYGGKLPYKQYVKLGDILEELFPNKPIRYMDSYPKKKVIRKISATFKT